MAGLLFIENREKTVFWTAVAERLVRQGHDIAWLVQNPVFARNLPGRVHIMPFPNGRQLDGALDLAAFPALVTDRGREHFDAGQAHYAYYADRVGAIIDDEQPDVVIGEPTLFHELLAVDLCARKGITFAHPVAERYPRDRFAVFDGASQRPLIESGETLDDAAALDLATRISQGLTVPSYMVQGGRFDMLRNKARWGITRSRVVLGRWRGERFNTPSPRRKLALNRSLQANLARWRGAASVPEDGARAIVYPLQMQPENTIDVWGRPDWDQVDIVRRLLAATPAGVAVAVKANPKPYYELSDALLELCLGDPRVRLLPVEMQMREALTRTAGAVTVTGTVGYEAVCGLGRCISTAHPVLDDHFPGFTAASIEDSAHKLLADSAAGRGSPAQGARLMQILTARSFAGVLSDPVSDPRCIIPDNVDRVARGIGLAVEQTAKSARAARARADEA